MFIVNGVNLVMGFMKIIPIIFCCVNFVVGNFGRVSSFILKNVNLMVCFKTNYVIL